jgi:hypothetical protein
MCDWHKNPSQPKPVNYDGCAPSVGPGSRLALLSFVPLGVVVALLSYAGAQVATGELSVSSHTVGLIVSVSALVAALVWLGVGVWEAHDIRAQLVGALTRRPVCAARVEIPEPKTLISADVVRRQLASTLEVLARRDGFIPTVPELDAVTRTVGEIPAMPLAAVDPFVLLHVAGLLNREAIREGRPWRTTPDQVSARLRSLR